MKYVRLCTHTYAYVCRLLCEHFAATSRTAGFLDLPPDLLQLIISSDDILDCDEALVFEAASRWLQHHRTQQQQEQQREEMDAMEAREAMEAQCTGFLQLVRFPLMDSGYLSDVVKPHALMAHPQRLSLLLEAFEHHALLACGRAGVSSVRTRRRRLSCAFSQQSVLDGHEDAVSALVVVRDYLVSGSWDSTIKVRALCCAIEHACLPAPRLSLITHNTRCGPWPPGPACAPYQTTPAASALCVCAGTS
ncbi:MAG: hypothetical protein EOP49_01105 [Sphingobacteriales bacterium]|nr:MAG: hypothetical protein EOP49_01105 [Sphingobacteriales bacterium]